jgi:hypothetical protein
VASGRGGRRFATRAIGSYRSLHSGRTFGSPRAFWEGIRFTLGAVLTLCLGITGPGPTVGLTLSTTSVSDTGGGDVSMVTIKTTHWLSLDASGVLSIVTTTTCNGSAPGTTTTAYKKGA